jgi:hypothetical protein
MRVGPMPTQEVSMRSAPRTAIASVIALLALLSLSCSLAQLLPATPTVTPTAPGLDRDKSPTPPVRPGNVTPTETPTTVLPGATHQIANSYVPDALPWVFTLHLEE